MIEGVAVDAHPVAQPVATAVVPHDAGLLGDAPGRLADDHDATIGARVEQRVDSTLRKRGVLGIIFDIVSDFLEARIRDLRCHTPSV